MEAIQDDPKKNRVKVPERIVAYCSGEAKKTRNGKVNSMRRNGRDAYGTAGMRKKKKKTNKKEQKAKRSSFSKLTAPEKQELERAARKGFVTLDGRAQGHRSLSTLCSSEALKASRVATAHRDWCDEREKPNIILYKASGRHSGAVLDYVVVDLSPLRLDSFFNEDNCEDNLLTKWKTEVLSAAASAGMTLTSTKDMEECSIYLDEDGIKEYSIVVDGIYSAGMPISELPFVSLGFFVGERTNAKAMARELATLWEIPQVEEPFWDEKPTKMDKKGHTQERKRAQRRRQKDDLDYLLSRF